ncbi:MAG: NUDIX domain-containing protein [Rhodocyclaceae bacterium]|nr:NUDIX domain-containing protein [Rhodocyclaceae bacterium]
MNRYRFCPCCGSPLEAFPIAGSLRQTCADMRCGWVFWDNPVPIVAAIIQCEDRDGAVLLARNAAWEPGKFALVTGFLERNEDPVHGVAREVREETALVAGEISLVGLYPFERKNELILAYHVRARGEIVLNEELAEYRLIAPEDLKPWDFGTGLAVRDWLSGRTG